MVGKSSGKLWHTGAALQMPAAPAVQSPAEFFCSFYYSGNYRLFIGEVKIYM